MEMKERNLDEVEQADFIDNIIDDLLDDEEKKKYIEVPIKEYKSLLFGLISAVSLLLVSLKIFSPSFLVVFIGFLIATIVTIVTEQKRNVKKIRVK